MSTLRIAALTSLAMLGESISMSFALATLAILGGIALVILSKPRGAGAPALASSDEKDRRG